MSNHDLQDLSNELVVLTARLVRVVRRNDVGVPAASTRVLSLLDELGPATVSALAEADRCRQPTMTGLVKGLTDKGWVDRSPHPDDARSTLVALNEAGRAQLTEVRARNAALVADRTASAGLSPEDLATAVAVLRELVS
ncbi:MarR family winged helix-turn-helix transcriptional regulator [Nocardioides aurantiacus]|uniref:MarR family transcriptional regulator n=1 Tax=Nocardioides aurantiacus TaxID=86796 RepID=A0A3N2CWW9_9ACTN|nr:MarR family transcriptional regulator [Nocardioides aurantiacus]ROR91979.1 MarR family transcriptional regulator [Nocardioides aurantiacus]